MQQVREYSEISECEQDDEEEESESVIPQGVKDSVCTFELPSLRDRFVKKGDWFNYQLALAKGHGRADNLEEALAEPQPIDGNIYRYMAVLDVQALPSSFKLYVILLIQILAPLLLVWEALQGPFEANRHLFCAWSPVLPYKDLEGGTKLLGALFLFGYCRLMGIACRAEMEANDKIRVLALKDLSLAKVLKYRWLYVGYLVNSFISIGTCIAMFFIFHTADGPKDVVFDSLSLIFLANLDNVAGDMGVITEYQWDEQMWGKYWTFVMGSSNAHRAEEELSSKQVQTSVEVRNVLLEKVEEVTGKNLTREAPKEWNRGCWWTPAGWDDAFHEWAVQKYVQEEFIEDLMANKELGCGKWFVGSVTNFILVVFSIFLPLFYLFFNIWSPMGEKDTADMVEKVIEDVAKQVLDT